MAINYFDSLTEILKKNQADHEYSENEALMVKVLENIMPKVKGIEDNSAAMSELTNEFEDCINNVWRLAYLIPIHDLVDEPDKWEILPDSPLIGKNFKTSNNTSVHVDLIEIHKDTIDGTPAAVYRINANSKLAFMLYGNTIIEYNTRDGKNINMTNNYSCACFIDAFPFQVPYPTVTTIINVMGTNDDGEECITEKCGFISDIRNISREEVTESELKNNFFSPKGTSLYPNATQEELDSWNSANA